MPTIKCSSCGNEIEISMMGDHLCEGPGGAGGAAAAAPPSTVPATAQAPAKTGGGLLGGLLGGGGLLDTFMPVGKSVHDKIGAIPPVDTAIASESAAFTTNMTTTVNSSGPWQHHADIAPLDRSYSRQPLTPLSLSSGSRSASPRTPGGRPSIGRADDYFSPTIANNNQNLSPQRRPGGYGGFGDDDVNPEPAYSPTSPKKTGLSLLTRIDSIAAGPYGRSPDSPPPMPGMNGSPPRRMNDDGLRPGTSGSGSSSGGGPPRRPMNNGYGGFGPPKRDNQSELFPGPNRSRTFQEVPSGPQEPAPFRAPSAPGPRPERLRDTSRPPPPRTGLVRTSIKDSGINLEAEFGTNNPYHSPTASVASSLSQGSRQSQASQPSSRTSPAWSTSSARKQTDSVFDSLMNDVQSSMDDMRPNGLPPTPDMPSPPRLDMRVPPLSGDRYDPAIQGGRPPSPPQSRWDRQDPAIQGGTRPGGFNDQPLPPSDASAPRRPGREPAVQKSRGDCKSCGLAITGKSISSADGRLTGRYHKACFACTTCREPFPTAEFYVHGDRPYCKPHYHKMNGSLCGSCRDGIEGQYLEDERIKKYHVQCFRCGDCQNVLRDGYFEVDGRAYCERDAFRRLQAQQRRSPSISSQRSYTSSKLAPPGRPGMRMPPGNAGGLPSRPGMPMGPGSGRMGPPLPKGPGMGLAPMPKMEKRMTRLGMM